MDHRHGPITAILAALARLGEADTRTVAVEAGLAYSTTVKKLRGLAADGRALRRDDGNGPALWRAATSAAPDEDRNDHVDARPAPHVASAAGPDLDLMIPSLEPDVPDREAPTAVGAAVQARTGCGVGQDADPSPGEPTDAAHAERPSRTAEDAPMPQARAEGTGPSGPAQSADTDTPANPSEPGSSADPGAAGPNPLATGTAPLSGSTATDAPPAARRGKGKLRDEVLAILQDHPDTAYKVSQLSKLLDGASQGAITNALHKLVTDGTVTQTVERPATYQAH